MTLDFLPPQAYTKETLLKAYNWLQGQTDQVREMASTPDQLVSLYLKATRHGQETLERPSLQNFKSELKNLAGMMGDLEKKQISQPPVHQQGPVSPQPPVSSPVQTQAPTQTQVQSAPQVTSQPPQYSSTESTPTSSKASHYDELTLKMIREVKNELNLSSEMEAMRMLVKLGYQKAQTLYK